MVSDKTNPTGELLSAQKFIGCRVENPRGEGLGRIEDLMIGAQDGLVAYAVVSFGGILRIGNKLFAFPWSSFRVDSARRRSASACAPRRPRDSSCCRRRCAT